MTDDVTKLCQLDVHLDGITYDQLEDYTTPATGEEVKRFNYEIEMVPSGASNEFRLLYKGRALGAKDVKVNFT